MHFISYQVFSPIKIIYKPKFSKDSHKFRLSKSCHTALETIKGFLFYTLIMKVDAKEGSKGNKAIIDT
jgi:retron-type reverse transcriptase